MSSRKTWRAGIIAAAIALLFLGQFATAIPPGEPPAEPTPPPPPPRPPDEEGWLCLDGQELQMCGTSTFDLYATNASWAVARVDGCDAADITVKKGTTILQRFTAYPGTVLCEPLWFTNETWPDDHPVEGVSTRYTIEIEPAQAQYFSLLAVLPQVLAQGNATIDKTEWCEVPFLAAGKVYCLFDGNFSITDFSAQILVAGEPTPLVLKRDDYAGSEEYPMNFSAVAVAVQGNRHLQMSADLPAGSHCLQMKGAGEAEWVILADGDNDLDGLDDVTEVQQDLDLAVPDVWGYRTVTGATETLQDLSDTLAAGKCLSLTPSWQYVTLNLYVPVAVEAIPVHAVAENGHFENFSIDGDPLACWNMTLDGFQGTGDNLVQFWDNESNWRTAPEWQFSYPDTRFLANLGQGTHAISFVQRENPLDPPRISFFSPLYPITELGEQRAGNPAVDSDLDGLDDGMDREPLDALQWHPGTALRLAMPYTYEDREDQADLQVTLSVAPPEHDYTTRSAPVAWHVGEGTDGAGVKCHVVPVVRCYGLGPMERSDYWYKTQTWGQFWDKSVVTHSLVGVDASGNPFNAAVTGLGFLPNPTNETRDPDQGDPANGYYYFLYPEQANKSWAYTIRLPCDHPLLQNRSGIPSITFDFAWQVLEENPNNGTLSLAHIYDCMDNVTIQSAVATYVATAGPGGLRYILGKPSSHAEYVALQALAANPSCEVIQPQGARPLNNSIVKAEQGVGLLPKYHYDKSNLATLSVADRIAHWRGVYPRNPSDSEVVFYCGKEKTILLLQELAAGVQYDCHANPATVPSGEIQYADVPATWSFGGLADDTRSYNIDNDWDGGPWAGSENARITARARHFRKVLQLAPNQDNEDDWVPAWASVDAGTPADNASVEFWLVLGNKGGDDAPDGILDITVADASGTIGPWLRFHGERMEYGSKNPATGETMFTVLDDVAVWPDEPIRVSLWYNCTNGTFFVDLGGAAYNLQNFVPFHDPANKPAALQEVTFEAKYVGACIDALGLPQAPRGTGDCGGAVYNRSNNAVDYAAWHAGDEERLVAWTQISNVSQGEIPPEQLQGDYDVLWEKVYREAIHAREEITLQDFPLQVKLTRASDRYDDRFETSNYVEVTTARGATQVGNVPQSFSDVQASSIADEEIYYNHQVTNERATSNPGSVPPQVQFDDVLDTYFEREEYRQTEVDWWERFYRPGSMRLSDLVKMKIEEIIDQIFETLWQEVRKPLAVRIQDVVNHMMDVEELAQAECAAVGVLYPAPTWTWDIVLPGNGFWFAPGFYNLDVQNGQLTGSIFNKLGVAVRRPSTDPGTFWVQATQLGPGQIVQLPKNKIAYRKTITLENLPEIVTRVTNAMDFIDTCHLAQLKGESVPLLVWAKIKNEIRDNIPSPILDNMVQDLKAGLLSKEQFLKNYGSYINSIEELFEPTRITGKMQEGLAPYPEFALVLPVKMTRELFAKVNKAAAGTKNPSEIVASFSGTPYQQHIGQFAHIPPGTPKDGANLASGIIWGKRAVLPDHVLVELWKAWGPDAVEIERVLGFLELCIDGTKDKHGNIIQPGYADMPLPLPGTPTRGAFMASLPSGYWPGMTMLDQWRILTGKTGFNDVLAGYFGASKRLTEYVNIDKDLLCQRALWYYRKAFGSQNDPLLVRNTPNGGIPLNVKNDPLYKRWRGIMKNIEYSTPRQEVVLEKWRHRVEFFQELYYGAGGDALTPAEFEIVARDIARTLVEDLSLGLKLDSAGNINYLEYVRNPALFTMMRVMEEGWWENQLNRAGRILSLKIIFGEEYANALIARGKELIPSFAGGTKKVTAKILEHTRDWIGSWPGGTEMSGPEFLAIQYSLTDFNLEMFTMGPDFNWELYYEFLETTYGPGLSSKPKPILGGGLPMYQVMGFPSETTVIRYALTMGWDFDTTYGVLTQWRMAQMKAFTDVPALPSAGFASQVALLEQGVAAIGDDLLRLEVGKTVQQYAIMEPLGPDPLQRYLGAISELNLMQAWLAGKVPIGFINTDYFAQPIYQKLAGEEILIGWKWGQGTGIVIYNMPVCKSIWDSRGVTFINRFGLPILIGLLMNIGPMQEEAAARIATGQPGTNAWWDVAVKYLVPVLLTTLIDATLVNSLITATGIGTSAAITGSFWGGVAASGATMGLSMLVALIVSLEWAMFTLITEQKAADVLTELNIGNSLEWTFSEATNASIAKHAGLEVGDVVTLKTTVENRGFRAYRDVGFWNYQPQNGDWPDEGSAFCYRARYSLQGASCSSDWQGCWNDIQRLYSYRAYYDWLGNYEKSLPRSDPDVQTHGFTFFEARASPVLTCELQIATEFHTRTEHDSQVTAQPLPGFNVMERSISEFMARATPTQSFKTLDELHTECTRAQREFRWKDAAQAAQRAKNIASAQPVVSEDELQDLLARRIELGVSGAPQGYYSLNGYWLNFTAEEQKAYAMLTCTDPTEFTKFFPAPGVTNAMQFVQQGFRVVAPEWSMLASPMILEETFASTSLSLLQQREWVLSQDPKPTIYANFDNRNGVLYLTDYTSDKSSSLSHSFQNIACGEMVWDFRSYQTTDKKPVYLDLVTDTGTAITIYIDYHTLYCNGLALAAVDVSSWLSLRVTWDCFTGTCAVWVNGQLLRAGIALSNTNPINKILFYTDVSDWAAAAIDYVCISGEEGYLGAQRLGYWNTETPGLILIPKSWFNLTQQAFEEKNQSQALLASIPLQTNIATVPSWGAPFITLTPGTTTTGALSFIIDGFDNPLVKADLIAPPGITTTFTPWVGFLQDLRSIEFTVNADPGMYAGATYLLLNVSCNGNVTAYQRVIPVRLAYEESFMLAIEQGPVLVEPGSGFRWATLYNNGTVPEAYLATFAGLPTGWIHSDAYVPIVASTFNTDLGGWVGSCTSGINSGTKVYAYAGNLVMEAPQQAEQLSASLSFPAAIEVRPGDVIRVSLRGVCTGGLSLVAGESFSVLAPNTILTEYKDVELPYIDFHTISNLTITGSFNPSDNIWIDAVVLEACTTRHAHEVWQQFSDSTASLNDYGWNVTFASGTPEISAWGIITNLAYTSATEPTSNYGTATAFLVGPGYDTFIQIPEYPAALLPYANFSSVGQYLYILHDPTYNNEVANISAWATGAFNETTSGSFPGVTWATQPGFTHLLGNYSLGGGLEPAWVRIDASGRAWVGLNTTAVHRFWSDEAGDEESRPAVRYTIPKAGITGGYLVVQSDVPDTFTLRLNLGNNITVNAGDAIRLGFNVTGAISFNITAGQFFAINPSAAGHYEMVLPFSTAITDLTSISIMGALTAGGSFNLDFLEVYHVRPYGDILGDTTLGGIYNDTAPLNTIKGYSPLIASTFAGTTDGFEGNCTSGLTACTSINGSLFINSSSLVPESLTIRRAINTEVPAGTRVRLRTSLNGTEDGNLTISGLGIYQELAIPITGPGNWREIEWTCPETTLIMWITIEVCVVAGDYLAVDYVLVEQPANAQPVSYAVGRRDVLPLKMAERYLSGAEITFGGARPSGIWEGWIYLPFLGAELGLAFLDLQRRLACQLTFNNTHLVVTNGTGVAVTTGDFSFFQHVQVAWDSVLGNWSIKINNITAFPVNYTDGTGLLSLAPAIAPFTSLRLDIGDAGTYYLDGVQASWWANYTGSFAQLVSNGSGMAFWLTPGERRVFYVTPMSSLPDQSFLGLFADAYTGQIRGVFDGTVISQPTYNIGLSSLSPVTQYCVTGEQVTFTLKVTNEGTLTDTFWLSCDNFGSAAYSLTPTCINLKSGESVCAKLVVSPTSVDVNYFTIRVASTHNETILHLWVVANGVSVTEIPDELSYVEGTTGNSFSWSASANWVGDPSYSLVVDGIAIASGLNWVPGETVLVSVDGLEIGTHTMEVRISAGAFGVDTTHAVMINVLPSEPLPPDTTAPLIQVTGEMEPTCPVGDIVVTAAFSDAGGSGLAQTLLYYTTGDWSAANCVSFDGDVAIIPMVATAVLLGSYHTVGPQACTVSYFLYAQDAAGNGAILDQDGWQVASVSDVSSYTGVPLSVQVVNTPVVGSLRLACDHVLDAGSGMVFPALFTLYYPGNDYAWQKPFYARAFIDIGYDVRFIDATCVRDLSPFSSLWYVDLNALDEFAVEEFYILVKDNNYGFISVGGSGYSPLQHPDFIKLNSASTMPVSPTVSDIHVDRDPNGVGWNQGVEFDLTYSDLVDMSVLGYIMDYFNPSSVVMWYNYWEGDDGNWNSITATPMAFTSDHSVRYRAEFHDDSYVPYSNVVRYYIQVREIGSSGPFYYSNVSYFTLASVQANPLTFNQTLYMNPDTKDYLPPEIGIPTIPVSCVDPALELDQTITCPVTDSGGSRLAWARVYYRAGTQAWDTARYVPIVGGVAILPHNAWVDFDVVEYYIGAGDNAGNIAFRGVAGLVPSDAAARANPFSFTVGSNTVIFYKTLCQAVGTTHLFPRELGDDFSYAFTLQNVGNAPQVYGVTTAALIPHAMPTFTSPGIIDGVPSFEVTLAPSQTVAFSLALSSIEPCLCNFTIIATSLTTGDVHLIPASYFINRPPVVIPAGDITYEQGTTGHALAWTVSDTSPVPGISSWYGIYSNASRNSLAYWATHTFDAPVPFTKLSPTWSATNPQQVSIGDYYIPPDATLTRRGVLGYFDTAVWTSFTEVEKGTVEFWQCQTTGESEVGLFRDGVSVATIRLWDTSVPYFHHLEGGYGDGRSFGEFGWGAWNHVRISYDTTVGECNITIKTFTVNGYMYIDRTFAGLPLLASLVPNEFRAVGSGGLDAVGLSFDPMYAIGDNLMMGMDTEGTFDPRGDQVIKNVDGLLVDPVTGVQDYKFTFATSDGWTTTRHLQNVRVLTPEPVVAPLSGDIAYEYGTTGHTLAWQVLDVEAPNPAYEVWKAGAELLGEYQGTETFRDVPIGGVPEGWARDSLVKVGVVDEWEGHTSCLRLLSNDQSIHTAAFTFSPQTSGTVEWYMYWNLAGSLDVNFGDDQGFLSSITADSMNGLLQIHPPGVGGYWYPLPAFYGTWHRFAFNFNAFTSAFSFTVYSYGCLGWAGWDYQPYGVSLNHTWTGTFERQAQGISYMQLVSTPGIYGQTADWFVDSIGLSWDPFYEVGDLMALEREMTQVAGGTWTSGDIIEVPVDGLDVGIHDYTFIARDGQGFASGKEATVVVYNVVPTIPALPDDLIFQAGTLAPSIEWVPSDVSTRGATYRITCEGIGEVASGTWTSGSHIAWNPSGLPIGEFHLLLELDDGLGGLLQDEVIVKANDQVTFVGTPSDFSYHMGEPTFAVTWAVSDSLTMNPTYDLYMRGFEGEVGYGSLFTSGTWTSGTSSMIQVDMGGMPVGLYLASIVAQDGLGSQALDQLVFCVTPEDMSPLDWLESQLVEAGSGMTCGTSSGAVTVDVTFDTAEDTQMAIGIWNEPPQVEGPDFATEGTYFTVDAEREAAVTFPIYVTVSLPGGFPAGMTESDVAAWLRLLTYDGVSESWVDPQFPIIDIDLAAGTATFEVWHLSTFALGYANGLPPKIDGPPTLTYEYGSPGPQVISWRLADITVGSNPSFAVFLDGVSITQGAWSFGMEVTIDASGLPIGVYNYEIIALDDLGGATSHRVPVNVYNVAPVVSSPGDLTYEAGTTCHVVTWVPADISTANPTYVVTIDTTQVGTGVWASGTGITISVDGLMPGSHEVECTLNDGFGLSITDEVRVVVTNAEPVITTPATITYEDGDPRPTIQWIIEDSSVLAGTFDLLRDGMLLSSGAWISGIPVEGNVGGLAPGYYTYQLVARDGHGAVNDAISTVIVLPDDDTGVSIANLNTTTTPFNVTVTFEDVDPSGIASVDWVKVNGTTIANFTVTTAGGQWIVTFDHTFPRDGTYVVELQVTDADADRPDDQASQVFAASVNVTGCDPVKNLMEGVLVQIDLLQVDIARVDCWVWRELLAFFAGRAESSMVKALDLYPAGDVPAATVRVWVAQCAVHVDGILVRVGEMIGAIDPTLAVVLEEHVTRIQVDLWAILQLLAGAG